MTTIQDKIAALPEMPAFKRKESWDGNDYLFFKLEHQIKEANALRAYLSLALEVLEDYQRPHVCKPTSDKADCTRCCTEHDARLVLEAMKELR